MVIPLVNKDEMIQTRHRKEFYDMVEYVKTILSKHEKMSVRQIFYQMAVNKIVELNIEGYNKVVRICKDGRLEGLIPWEKIVDRSRFSEQLSMWKNPPEFYDSIRGMYRRDIWDNQPAYFEVWLEKAALYDIFKDVIYQHGILLMPIRGFSSLSIIHERSLVFKRYAKEGRKCKILYFGDHDPSGLVIDQSIRSTLRELKCDVEVERIGLTYDDIFNYDLPPNIEKEKDTNLFNYKEQGFELQAELDALPVDVLKTRLHDSVVTNLDITKYKEHYDIEQKEGKKIRATLELISTLERELGKEQGEKDNEKEEVREEEVDKDSDETGE